LTTCSGTVSDTITEIPLKTKMPLSQVFMRL
jgi:hypothetical protein